MINSEITMERGGNLFRQVKRPVEPEDRTVTAFRNGTVTLRENVRTDGFTNSVVDAGYQHISKGDLVIHGMDSFAGAIGVSDSDGKGSPILIPLVPLSDKVNPHFYSYFMRNLAQKGYISSLGQGIRIRSVDFKFNKFKSITMPYPSIEVQNSVVEMLEQKTTAIDSLIASLKQKLIHLDEYKTALIHNAVTKGLDANGCRILDGMPAAEMTWKDSGVEWIGEVPDGWEVVKFKSVASISMGETILKDSLIDDGIIPVRSATKTDKYFGYVNSCSKKLKVGDIVVGARGTIGKPSIVTELSTSTQTTLQLSLNGKINSKYCFYWLLGNHDEIFSYDQTAIPQYTVDDMNNVFIATQERVETRAIVDYLDNINEALLQSKEAINKKIALLLEYKKSLINESVGGALNECR